MATEFGAVTVLNLRPKRELSILAHRLIEPYAHTLLML